jgi:hypothetical protein
MESLFGIRKRKFNKKQQPEYVQVYSDVRCRTLYLEESNI